MLPLDPHPLPQNPQCRQIGQFRAPARFQCPAPFRSLLIAALLWMCVGGAAGRTLHVPADFAGVQTAIEATDPGDTVLVAAGDYCTPGGWTDFRGKRIVLRSVSGPNETWIDAAWFHRHETRLSRLEGFRLASVSTDSAASPTIVDCLIRGTFTPGSAVRVRTSAPLFIGCQFLENTSDGEFELGGGGGALRSVRGGIATLIGCVFAGNKSNVGNPGLENGVGGAMYVGCDEIECDPEGMGEAHLFGCTLTGNLARTGGAIHAGGDLYLTGCTVAGNRAWLANGGGTAGGIQSWHTSILDRTIVWGNCAESGLGSQIEVKQGQTSLTCCATDPDGCIGVTYDGPQVFDDPIFCSPLPCSQAPTIGGLYGVMESSPCLAENSPCGMLIGAVVGCHTPLAAPEDPDADGTVDARRPEVSLGGPWPNPASGSLAFTIRLSQRGHARLEVLDSTGRLAEVIAEDDLAAGEHVYGWSLRDDRGGALPSGVYYLHLTSLGKTASKKFIVLH